MNPHKLPSIGYDVIFDDTLTELHRFIQQHTYSKILILTDRNTCIHCLPVLQEAMPGFDGYDVIEVDPGEENKNIDFCVGIWKMMLDFGADRQSLLINLGGGVITDMGGFTASTFKRGIDFVQVPTTLLSQVDASVGGKTGVDMDHVKNIIGTFAQPKAVFIASTFLRTLNQRQLVSGFAEIIKHGLIADRSFYEAIKGLDATAISLEHIRHSVAIKNNVVTQDPLEKGLRKILNFGHTIGHALEGHSLANDRNPLLHGEAIAAGMICEAYLAHRLNGLSEDALDDIIQTFRRHFPDYSYDREIYEALLALMKNDKKNAGHRIGFSLLSTIGQCDIDVFVEEDVIVESLDFYRNLIGSGR
jgi:3-dehydroquinate synthase